MARDGRTGERANGRANEGVLRGPRGPKKLQHDVQNEGGGGQRLFEQCLKKLQIWWRLAPLSVNLPQTLKN